jgi:hypothetical protein
MGSVKNLSSEDMMQGLLVEKRFTLNRSPAITFDCARSFLMAMNFTNQTNLNERHSRLLLTIDQGERVINTSSPPSISMEYDSIRQAEKVYCVD